MKKLIKSVLLIAVLSGPALTAGNANAFFGFFDDWGPWDDDPWDHPYYYGGPWGPWGGYPYYGGYPAWGGYPYYGGHPGWGGYPYGRYPYYGGYRPWRGWW